MTAPASNAPDHAPAGWWEDPDPERALAAYLQQSRSAYAVHDVASVKKLIPPPSREGATALDYGCGGGNLALHLARTGYRTLASDVSACSLAACRLHLQREGLDAGVELIRNDAPDYWAGIPGDLDLVVAKDVIEHIDDDAGFLGAAASRLRRGGHLVLVTQNNHSWNYLIEAPRMRRLNPDWCGWHPTEHVRFYNRPALEVLLEEAGLEPAAWRSVYLVPYRAFTGPVSRRLRHAVHRLLGENAYYWPDRLVGGRWPFNQWGWSLQVRAVKN